MVVLHDSHVLFLIRTPSSHVLEHAVHLDHSPAPGKQITQLKAWQQWVEIKNVSVPGYIANWMSVYKIIQILKQGHATILWRPYTVQFHHKALKKITISISIVCIAKKINCKVFAENNDL